MGQKVNPIALRLGVHHNFKSIGFYSKKRYKDLVLEDMKIRETLFEKLKSAGIGDVVIERSLSSIKITIFVVRPGIVIGRGGSGLEILKKMLLTLLGFAQGDKSAARLELKVEPIKEPSLSSYLVGVNISEQLARRMPFRRIMKQSAERVMAAGAKGVRIVLSGRIAGAEIARRERVQIGKVSLSTIRENIDFASVPVLTKSGYVGVKVWINRP